MSCYTIKKDVMLMNKISRITTQKKNKQRYNIFLTQGKGDQYGFSVDEAILIENRLHKGMELSQDLIDELQQNDTFHKSYSLALNYLSFRMRTKKEMYDYLKDKEVDDHDIPDIMDKLINEGLLDDRQFTDAFVNTRISTSSKGPQLVKRELIQKGVSTQIAEEAMEKYTYEIQYEKAIKWIEKRLRTTKRDSFKKQQQKMRANLMQKGFSTDIINDVLAEVQNNQDADEEKEALIFHAEKLLRRHERKYTGYTLQQKVKEGLYRQGFSFDKINEYINEKEWGIDES